MSPSPGNLLVRANYLAIAVFAPFLALFVATFPQSGFFDSANQDWPARAPILLIAMFLFVLPGARAIRRAVVSGTVIPPGLVNERPVVAWVVSLAGGAGHFFFVISMSVAIDLGLRTEWPDDIGGPVVFVFGLALFFYLIALLGGELALVGNGRSDAADAPSRVPFC
jgi:hypothetical protein